MGVEYINVSYMENCFLKLSKPLHVYALWRSLCVQVSLLQIVLQIKLKKRLFFLLSKQKIVILQPR
jgi:hypothetical protein